MGYYCTCMVSERKNKIGKMTNSRLFLFAKLAMVYHRVTYKLILLYLFHIMPDNQNCKYGHVGFDT